MSGRKMGWRLSERRRRQLGTILEGQHARGDAGIPNLYSRQAPVIGVHPLTGSKQKPGNPKPLACYFHNKISSRLGGIYVF